MTIEFRLARQMVLALLFLGGLWWSTKLNFPGIRPVQADTGFTIKQRNPVVNEGNRLTLSAITANGSPLSGVTWSSGSPDIAQVDPQTGLARGLHRGFATVTATAPDGQSVSVFLTVVRVEKGKGEKVLGDTKVDSTGQIFLSNPQQNIIMRAPSALDTPFELFAGMKNLAGKVDGLRQQALFAGPTAIGLDNGPTGGIYIADTLNHSLRKAFFTNEVRTIVGGGAPGLTTFDPNGTAPLNRLSLNAPRGLVVESGGNVYLADTDNHAIYYLDFTAGRVLVVAGIPGQSGLQDGPGRAARFLRPAGIALAADGRTLAVTDEGNNRVRLIELARAADGSFTTQVSSIGATRKSTGPAAERPRLAAGPDEENLFTRPFAISADAAGNLYVVDATTVRVITRPTSQTPEVVDLAQPEVSFAKPAAVTVGSAGTFVLDAQASDFSQALQLISVEPPSISSLGQTEARIDGGLKVTIRGANFAPESRVFLGDAEVREVTVASATEIQFTVPPQLLPGERTLSVQTRGGIAQVRFRIVPKRLAELADGEGTFAVGGLPYVGDGLKATNPAVQLFGGRPALDKLGNLYLPDAGRIRRIDGQTGIITTVAGTGVAGFSGDGGPALAAQLAGPVGVTVDGAGNLFIVDGSSSEFATRIRRVDALTGIITTAVGGGGKTGNDLPANEIRLFSAHSPVIDQAGNLFFVNNQTVYQMDPTTKRVRLFAGTGEEGFSGDGGPALQAKLSLNQFSASLLNVDAAGNLFIVDIGNRRIRRVDAQTGIITTVAGNGAVSVNGALEANGDGGPAVNARLSPVSVTVDGSGNLFISDVGLFRIRRVDAQTGIIQPVAGNGLLGDDGDGGPALQARLSPAGLVVDGMGNLFVGGGSLVRRVDGQTGTITTVAGSPSPSLPSVEGVPATTVLAGGNLNVSGRGDIFLAGLGRILRVDGQTGLLSTYAGVSEPGFSGDGGPATRAKIGTHLSTAFDNAGNLLVGDLGFRFESGRVRRIDSQTGIITTVAGNGKNTGPSGDDGPASEAAVQPAAIAVDPFDAIAIVEPAQIRTLISARQPITRLAGTGKFGFSGDGGRATEAQLSGVRDLAFDSGRNLYLVSSERVRRVDAKTGIITTVAGNGLRDATGDGGPATQAGLGDATDLVIDGGGNLLLASMLGGIRRVDAQTGTITTISQALSSPQLTNNLGNVMQLALDRNGNLYLGYNQFVRVIKGVVVPGAPGIGPVGGLTSSIPPRIANVERNKKFLVVNGTGLGGNGLKVLLNDREVTSLVNTRLDTQVTLKGSLAKLNLKSGSNTVVIMVNGQTSNPFTFQSP